MDDDYPPRICETCKRPYTLGHVEMNHMDPPDSYQMGSGRYCLACWLMVGPTDFPESWEQEPESQSVQETGNSEGRDDVPDLIAEASAPAERAEPRRRSRRVLLTEEGVGTPFEDNERVRSTVPEMCEMLECDFGAADAGLWEDFIARFGETQGRICYYPSAGGDFRPLVYQQIAGMEKLDLLAADRKVMRQTLFDEIDNPKIRNVYEAPDLWILSDYSGDRMPSWLESGVIHQDERVEIRILSHTELHPRTHHYRIPPDPRYVSGRATPMTGRVFYLRVAVTNAIIGTVEADVLYFCVENVHLISRFLLRKRIPVSHLVWVRDGSGFGGGRLRHDFVVHLLPLFQTRWLFVGELDLRSYSPTQVRWPIEFSRIKKALDGVAPNLQVLGDFQAGMERMVFCEVDNAEPDEALRRDFEREKLRRRERFQHSRQEASRRDSGVYLWLCSEGWMKFGPYAWLRFDDECQKILGPEGKVVASKIADYWKVSDKDFGGHHPMITSRPEHPRPDRGTPP